MNATTTLAADARLTFERYKALKAAGRDYTDVASHLTILLDQLVVENTGFGGTFLDLVEAQQRHGYRPTFREAGREAVAVLADVYDYCAAARSLESSYRPERAQAATAFERKYHLRNDFGVYKATIVRSFEDNDRGREYDHVRELLARRTQRYTLAELEELFGFLWTSSDECVAANGYDDYSALEVHTAAKKIERGEAALAQLEALRASQS